MGRIIFWTRSRKSGSRVDSPEVTTRRLMGLVHVCLGVAIVAGGDDRFPPPTYEPLLQWFDGQVWPWGVWTLLAGLMMLLGNQRWLLIGATWIAMAWMLCAAALFGVAVVKFDNAGSTAMVAYGGYALIDAYVLRRLVFQELMARRQKKAPQAVV